VFFCLISYYPTLKRRVYEDEQIFHCKSLEDIKPGKKRRSIVSSSTVKLFKMQPPTTNDLVIGVPSRLCSVCGDISTGKYSSIFKLLELYFHF
jgi:hypothetical protein